jgi:hypothetical protein
MQREQSNSSSHRIPKLQYIDPLYPREKQLKIIQDNLIVQYNHMYLLHKTKNRSKFKLDNNVLQNLIHLSKIIDEISAILQNESSHVSYIMTGLFLFHFLNILSTHYQFYNYREGACFINEKGVGRNCINTTIILYLYSLSFPQYSFQLCDLPEHVGFAILHNKKISFVADYGNSEHITQRLYDDIHILDQHLTYLQTKLVSKQHKHIFDLFHQSIITPDTTNAPIICHRANNIIKNYIIASDLIHQAYVTFKVDIDHDSTVTPTISYFHVTLLNGKVDLTHLYQLYNKLLDKIRRNETDEEIFNNYRREFNNIFKTSFSKTYIIMRHFVTASHHSDKLHSSSSSSSGPRRNLKRVYTPAEKSHQPTPMKRGYFS